MEVAQQLLKEKLQHPPLLPEPSVLVSSTETLPLAGSMAKKVIKKVHPRNSSGEVPSLLDTDWLFRFQQLHQDRALWTNTSPSLVSSPTALTTFLKEGGGDPGVLCYWGRQLQLPQEAGKLSLLSFNNRSQPCLRICVTYKM